MKKTTATKRYGQIIPKADFITWHEAQELVCSYCGVAEKSSHAFLRGRRLTIDRIDSSRGYIPGNLALACHTCNTIKTDVLTFVEMKEIGEKYLKSKLAA